MSSPFAVVRRCEIDAGRLHRVRGRSPSRPCRACLLREGDLVEPSGDQAGSPSGCLRERQLRRGRCRVAFITQMFGPPIRSLMNAIFVLSGDHAGSMSCFVLFVSRVWPRAVGVHHPDLRLSPSRLLWKAIFVPFGDHAGAVSSALGGREPLDVLPVGVHHVDVETAAVLVRALAREGDLRAVGRPGRLLVGLAGVGVSCVSPMPSGFIE